MVVSWAKQHGRRGDLTLGMLQEHFKWYKGESGSKPGLVRYSLGESGSEPGLVSYSLGKSGFLRMLDRVRAWEPNHESSALHESSAPE